MILSIKPIEIVGIKRRRTISWERSVRDQTDILNLRLPSFTEVRSSPTLQQGKVGTDLPDIIVCI